MEIIGKIPYVRLRTARRVFDKIHYTRKLSTSMRWYGTTARKSSSEKFRFALTTANRVLRTDLLVLTKFYNRYYTTKEYFSKSKTQNETAAGKSRKTTSQSCSLQPKQVLVLHLPPNSKVEKKIHENSLSKKLPVVAAIIPANAITGKELKGALEVTNVTTVDFNELEAKKVMLVPVVIYESKDMKNINVDAQNEISQKTVLPSSKPEKELTDSSRITKIEDSDGKEIYSFQLPSNLGTNEDNLPISSLKLVLQMEMPDVEKILGNYVKRKAKYESNSITAKNSDAVDFNRSINSLGSDVKLVKDNKNNANKMDDKIEDYIIPLDFKAEVKGVLGLNMKHLNVQSTEDIKSMDFNNLISAFAGNVASVAFQKSFMRSNVDQRTYSTTSKPPPTRDSPSELFQSYKTKMNGRGKYKYRLSKTDSTHRKSTESKQTSRNPHEEDINFNVLSESNVKGKKLCESTVNSSVPLSKNIGQENTKQTGISSRDATTQKKSFENQIPSDTVKMPNTKIIERYPREEAINFKVVSEHNAKVKSFNESTVNSSVQMSKNVGQDNAKQTDTPSGGATSLDKSDVEKQISSNNVKMPKIKAIKGFIKNRNVSAKKPEDLERNSNKLNLTPEITEKLAVNSKQSYKKALKGTIFNKNSTQTDSAKSGDAIHTSFLSGLFKKGGSKRSKDDEACYSKRQEAKNSKEKTEKPMVDCSMFDKKNNVENKSGDKKEAEDCSRKKAPEKKESKIDCSALLKEKGGADQKKSDPKEIKGECSGTDKKAPEKKESKIDCSAFLKEKGGSDKNKADPKSTKGECSRPGIKSEKKESKIDCAAFLEEKRAGDKKSDPKDMKGACSNTEKKGSEKKESKIDCSAFLKEKGGADKKKPDQKDTKGDCSGSGKKGDEKKESKIDCSAFLKEQGGADKKKPDQKDAKGDCSGSGKKGNEKKESKIDCSAFLKEKGGADKKKPNQKDTKGDCSGTGKKGNEKKESKIDCSAFLKEKGGADKKPDQKDTKGNCSGTGKKGNEKKESKLDCSAFLKEKGGADKKKPDQKDTKGDCSGSGKKGDEKKESKIDCSAFLKEKGGADKKKPDQKDTKGDCSGSGNKGSEKKESKIDCSAFLKEKGGADKKKPDQKDTKGDCSGSGKKVSEKKESKIDCSAFLKEKGGADKKKPDQKDTKGDCSGSGKKGSEKKESKIDCSAFLKDKGGADKKKPDQKDTKGDCSGSGKKGDEKKESKIDCSAFLKEKGGADKKKPDQKDTKGDCSGTGKKGNEKKESKLDCSAFLKEKGGADKKKPDQKDTKGDCSGSGKKGDEKKESKIDCSAFLKEQGGADKKKPDQKDAKGDCSGSGKKGSEKKESKIDCSAVLKKQGGTEKKKPDQKDTKGDCSGSGKKGDEKKESKIDCSAFLKEKGGADKKKPDQKDTKGDCSGTGKKSSEKKESKIDCSAFLKEQRGADKKNSDKKMLNKSNCSNANKEGEGSFQTVKIALSKDVQIEITNAQISKENLNALQKALNNKSGSGGGNCGAPINCMSLVGYSGENEEPLELAKSGETFTLEISGPASLNIKPNEQNKPTNDKGNGLNNSPFKGGINKHFSTDARRVPSVRKLKRKIKFASVKTVELNKSNPSFNILNYDGIGPIAIDHPLQITPTSADSDQRLMSSQGNAETKGTNKVVKIVDCREICLDSTPIPEVGDYDVLLKVHSVGLSGSDLYMYENGANANNAVTLGHEASGIVEQVGKCVSNIKVGDHVAVEPGVPCGVCDFCKRGACNLCPETIFNGSLAQYSVHPSDFCHKLPEDCNLESGALMHPLALAVHACKKASISVQSNVLIIGACPLGLSSIICCKAMGASHVTIVDSMERNLCVAEKLHVDSAILVKEDINDKELAECVLQKLSRYGPPNVVINCSGCTKSLNTAIMTLRPGGICVLAGCQSECANFNILETLMKELKIKSSFRSCNMFPTAIALLESCRADVSHLITHRFTLPEVKEAFETALDEENVGAVKVIVSCQQGEKTGDK